MCCGIKCDAGRAAVTYCVEHVANMSYRTIQIVTVEETLHELHTKYQSLLETYTEKNLLDFFNHDISECNAVLKTIQGSRNMRSLGELDEGRTLKAAECSQMEKSREGQDCAFRGTIEGTGGDEQKVFGKSADEGRDINDVHTGILSLIRSKWIQKPKMWGDSMIYGQTNVQYKRRHEFQALLRLYLNGRPGKVHKDPIDTVVMQNVKIAFGRFFVNKTDAQKLSYFYETLELLFGSYLPLTLEELVHHFGISVEGRKRTPSSSMVIRTDPEISITSRSGFDAKAQVHFVGRSSHLSSKIAGKNDTPGVLGLSGLQHIVTLKHSKSEKGAVSNQLLPRLVVSRPGLSIPSMRQLHFSQDYGKALKRTKNVHRRPNATTQRHTKTNTQSHLRPSILTTPERCRMPPVLVSETNELTGPATIQSKTLVPCKSLQRNKLIYTHPNATTQMHTQTNIQLHLQPSIFSTPERCRMAHVLVPATNELTVPATIQSKTLVACKSCETITPHKTMVLDYSLNADDIGLLIQNVIRTMS